MINGEAIFITLSGFATEKMEFKTRDRVSPAFIIELKKNKTVEEALQQIRAKNYAQRLDDCTGEKFAIGINYMTENTNKDDNRHHYIKIEELQ